MNRTQAHTEPHRRPGAGADRRLAVHGGAGQCQRPGGRCLVHRPVRGDLDRVGHLQWHRGPCGSAGRGLPGFRFGHPHRARRQRDGDAAADLRRRAGSATLIWSVVRLDYQNMGVLNLDRPVECTVTPTTEAPPAAEAAADDGAGQGPRRAGHPGRPAGVPGPARDRSAGASHGRSRCGAVIGGLGLVGVARRRPRTLTRAEARWRTRVGPDRWRPVRPVTCRSQYGPGAWRTPAADSPRTDGIGDLPARSMGSRRRARRWWDGPCAADRTLGCAALPQLPLRASRPIRSTTASSRPSPG